MLDEDDRAELDRLRRAAYAPDATVSARDLERLAELERRAVAPADRPDPALRTPNASPSTSRTTEAATSTATTSDTTTSGRRVWPMLVGALVIGAIAFAAGSLVGSTGSSARDDVATAVPPVTGELLGHVPGAELWLADVMGAAEWDDGTLQYLGAVDGASVLVGTVGDGTQLCRVVAADDVHDIGCSTSDAIGALVATRLVDGTLFVMRDPELGAYFVHEPRSYDSVVVSASLREARALVSVTGDLPIEAVSLAGVFDGISVWTTMVDGRMCVDLVSGTTVVGDPRQQDEVCSLVNGDQTELYDPFPELERAMSFVIVRTGDNVMVDASSAAR